MKKAIEPDSLDDLAPRPALDFSKGVRGKYLNRTQQTTRLVAIDSDLFDVFPDEEAINEALHSLKKIAVRSAKPTQQKAAIASR